LHDRFDDSASARTITDHEIGQAREHRSRWAGELEVLVQIVPGLIDSHLADLDLRRGEGSAGQHADRGRSTDRERADARGESLPNARLDRSVELAH